MYTYFITFLCIDYDLETAVCIHILLLFFCVDYDLETAVCVYFLLLFFCVDYDLETALCICYFFFCIICIQGTMKFDCIWLNSLRPPTYLFWMR